MLRRAMCWAAGFHCWIVGVWYRNGRSVLFAGTRDRDRARIVFEHADMDARGCRTVRGANCTRATGGGEAVTKTLALVLGTGQGFKRHLALPSPVARRRILSHLVLSCLVLSRLQIRAHHTSFG